MVLPHLLFGEGIDNITRLSGPKDLPRGTSSYRLRRLARDAPEIFVAYERGDYPSVHAAARAAGLVKRPNARQMLVKGWAAASAEERAWFLQWVQEEAPYAAD